MTAEVSKNGGRSWLRIDVKDGSIVAHYLRKHEQWLDPVSGLLYRRPREAVAS